MTVLAPALILAAPSSNSGKTTLTLALLRAFRQAGLKVASAKVGPDYIDPAFHQAASGRNCVNLDGWAQRVELRQSLLQEACADQDLVLIEGVMGLFDGAADGRGSTADLAVEFDLPVVLLVDAARQSHSIAALVHGFASFCPDLKLAGVILNRVGSDRHEALLRDALLPLTVPVLGVVRRQSALQLPERHLGLVQACENKALERFLDAAAVEVSKGIDLTALQAVARSISAREMAGSSPLPPFGQRIAVARDVAFAFAYPHVLDGWRAAGAELSFFSPYADEAPDLHADAVYLPGGYPELHAGRLAANQAFLNGLRTKAARGCFVFGECGGYMVLGQGMIDAEGQRHEMAGLLGLESDFQNRRLHLGYRCAELLQGGGFCPLPQKLAAHEFHYARVAREEGQALFQVEDALGTPLGQIGLRQGSVSGSFLHLIDRSEMRTRETS